MGYNRTDVSIVASYVAVMGYNRTDVSIGDIFSLFNHFLFSLMDTL
jgi:hypothetical protein